MTLTGSMYFHQKSMKKLMNKKRVKIKYHNITSYAISHIGKVRSNHEDNFLLDNGQVIDIKTQKNIKIDKNIDSKQYIESSYKKRTNKGIFTVCDGMGGHNCGEIASFIAVRNLLKLKDKILQNDNIQSSIDSFQKYIEYTNKDILNFSKQNNETKGMGTTLVSLIIKNKKAALINLGDSTAFAYEKNKLSKITKSHTEGQRLLDLGIISKDEVKKLRIKNALTRFLGMSEEMGTPVGDVHEIDVNNDMYFILCSDGLTDILSEDKIEEVLNELKNQPIKNIARYLVNAALIGDENTKGGRDNITVVIVKVEKDRYKNIKKSKLNTRVKKALTLGIITTLTLVCGLGIYNKLKNDDERIHDNLEALNKHIKLIPLDDNGRYKYINKKENINKEINFKSIQNF